MGRTLDPVPRTNKLTNRSDDEDEAAELMRELEKIKKERLEQKEKEVSRFLTPLISITEANA